MRVFLPLARYRMCVKRTTRYLVVCIAMAISIGAYVQSAQAADTDYLVEYPVAGKPFNIAVEAPGRIWFTMPDDNAVGFLDTADPTNPQFTKHDLANPNSEPYDIVHHDGSVWFTEKSGNRIGRIDVSSSQIDEFDIPTSGSVPTGIDVAPNGMVWFLEQKTNHLAKFDPTSNTFIEVLYVPPAFGPSNAEMEDVVVVNDDKIWFTAPNRDEIVKYLPSKDKFFAKGTRPPGSPIEFAAPIGIDLDATGVPWSTSYADSAVGRFMEGTLTYFRWSPTMTPNAGPAHIAFYDTGKQWYLFYSAYNAGTVGWLSARTNSVPTGTFEHALSSADARPWGVDVDASGCAWFALTGINAVAEWCAPYARQIWLPYMSSAVAIE